MKLDEKKFSEATLQLKDNLQSMDEADGHALADVLDILAGIICPELLRDEYSTVEIAKKYNLEVLKGKIDILMDKKLDVERRALAACTCACLAFPIRKPEMHIRCPIHKPTKPTKTPKSQIHK
jgi:hypothetical protein